MRMNVIEENGSERERERKDTFIQFGVALRNSFHEEKERPRSRAHAFDGSEEDDEGRILCAFVSARKHRCGRMSTFIYQLDCYRLPVVTHSSRLSFLEYCKFAEITCTCALATLTLRFIGLR